MITVTDKAIYSVWVGGVEVNNYPLTASQAIDISHEWAHKGYDDIQIEVVSDVDVPKLPLGYPEMIMRWATSVTNHMDYQEFGGDWWGTWRSPSALHSYDINIHTPYPLDDIARVIVHHLVLDDSGDTVTDMSNFCFIGTVDISHML
jgi:hypothetical protein